MLIPRFHQIRSVSLSLLLAHGISGHAQNTLEFVQDGTYKSRQAPVPKGPTSIPQTLDFFLNQNGGADMKAAFSEPQSRLSVTFSFDDQSYITVPQHVTGMTFGATSGASTSQVKGVEIVNTNYHFKDSGGTVFTAHPEGPAGNGFDPAVNAGLQIFLSAKPLMNAQAPKTDTSRYYYGKLRMQFSRPVDNPVISLAGLGATTNFSQKHLGFATELELITPSVSLLKLSGNEEMVLDETKTKILHSKSRIGGACGGGAGCGSILVDGTKITNLVFAVYLRTDDGPGTWGTEKVTNSGDTWHISVSMAEQ
ncbi:hypothetical protein [Dyadobacter bucti]|uniref:hypothetical protein n=1 Tax=Dyadobacter bucti TaxID=2572203 RepID=UPI00110977E4|nr:hypothetical protein [Dyadobacter bucti]